MALGRIWRVWRYWDSFANPVSANLIEIDFRILSRFVLAKILITNNTL